MMSVTIIDCIPNDIRLIVYRYVHLAQYRDVIAEYQSEFGQHWCENRLLFYNNYNGLELMWRDLSVRSWRKTDCIYKHKNGNGYKYPLHENY